MAATPAATATAAAFLFSSKSNPNPKPKTLSATPKPRISNFNLTLFSNPHLSPSIVPCLYLAHRGFGFLRRCAAVQDIALEEEKTESVNVGSEDDEKRRRLYVVNFPWDLSAPEIEKLFGECGTVNEVEIMKQKNGKSRGFAFITMASNEEAQAVIAKFDSFELNGRIIRVDFAKNRMPSPPPLPPRLSPPNFLAKAEGRYKIFASNLAWKVRATNLKVFFSEKFKPISARVVFDKATGRSTGYGFVKFATMEEAEAAASELDGKELMGRPLRLRISRKVGDGSGEPVGTDDTELHSQDP